MTVWVDAAQFAGFEWIAVQVAEFVPFQSPRQFHVAEDPTAGNAGEDEALPCEQYASVPNDESTYAYVFAAVPQVPLTEALQDDVAESQPYPELQSQVQAPAVADRLQFCVTVWSVAVEWALASAIVPPQTSATQESAGPSTYPGTQAIEFSVTEGVPMAHVAVPAFVPMVSPVPERTGFDTAAVPAWAIAGTEYPLTVVAAQPVGTPAWAPSIKGSETDPAGSLTRPATDPEIPVGNVPEMFTEPPVGGTATTWNHESVRFFPFDFLVKSTAPTVTFFVSYAENANSKGLPGEREILNLSGLSLSFA